MTERINDEELQGEYPDSDIPNDPAVVPDASFGEYTDADIPGEDGRHRGGVRPGEFTDADIPGEEKHAGTEEEHPGHFTDADHGEH
ncbi:hypothetical protein GCM10027515_21740 [Schumannella luteola]|uniref:Uncharacterized protein n=1 Tax=Schumannella luteola TaxID=472059 RepID=A0A852YFF6_9MICO|nr:hypothetical protein [Schumannella luteola]NYH00031.1 hypothetical protein [Schumannella luteola]TPX06590.1 hypothetical protein FJ656_00100 [Schumannella luteola]